MTLKDLQPPTNPSSTVELQGYDKINRILYIKFKNGIWAYYDFLDKEYAKFMAAESAGKFLSKEIIPNHLGKKVELPEN